MSKRAKFEDLKEVDFQEQVIAPLMRKMGYQHVRITHGREEFGKDVIGHIEEPLGSTITVVVAKVGDISGKTGKATYEALLATIDRQIQQAFDMPIEDPTRPKHEGEQYAAHVIVWTSGTITGNSKKLIMKQRDSKYRNVDFIDGDKTLDLLEKHYPDFFLIGNEDLSNYISALKEKNSRLVELHMLGGVHEHRPLSKIFVSPTMEHVIPKAMRSKQARQEGKRPDRFTYEELLQRLDQNTALIGGMGIGKTTLLRRIVIDIIEKNENNSQIFPIPILIEFRDIKDSANEAIVKALENEYCKLCGNGKPRDIRSDLVDGNIIILIDGLDEIDTTEMRHNVIELINEFISHYPKSKVIITSRQDDILNSSPLPNGFIIYKLLPLSIEQVTDLVINWLGENEESANRLIKLITEPITLSTIQTTPLTIALIVSLYERGLQDLPSSLTELFEQYIELALGRWDSGREISTKIEWNIKARVLRNLCWDMLHSGDLEVSLDDIKRRISVYAEDKGLEIDAERFYKEIVDRSGLLIPVTDTNVEFKHRAFRDYFAGVEIAARENSADMIIHNFYERAWSTPIFFAFGTRRDANSDVLRLLEEVPVKSASYYGWNLGLIGQAAYLIDKDTKERLVKSAISAMVTAWDNMTQEFNSSDRRENKSVPPHIFLLWTYTLFTQIAVGSSTLAAALRTLANECLEKIEDFESMADFEKAQAELFMYSVAMACAHAGELESYVNLFNSEMIKDPALIFIAQKDLEGLIDAQFYVDTNVAVEDLQQIMKKLKRTISKNQEYINNLITSKPLMLPRGE